jgi:nucleoside-diphosphate-sugar epimerase
MGERPSSGRRVLIPGGFGFIGSHLLQACLDRGDDVTVISLQRTAPSYPIRGRYDHRQLDLRDGVSVRTSFKGERYHEIFNLSGYISHAPLASDGRAVYEQHLTGLLNILDAIDVVSLKGFVQVGSSDEYGAAPAPQSETMRESPIAPYSAAKVAATHFVEMLARTTHFPGTVLRFFLVYGPGQDNQRFLPQIIRGCLNNMEFPASEGRQLRDFTYIADVVEAMLLAAQKPLAHGKVLNIASGQPLSIRQVVESVVRQCGSGKPQYGKIAYREGENMALFADVQRAVEVLGWKAKTPFSEGLAKTIDFYREQR